MIPTLTPTPIPTIIPIAVDPSATVVTLPAGITVGAILLLCLWAVANQLPAIMKSLSELIQTIIGSRKNQNNAYQELLAQQKSDREYFEKERARMQSEIDRLSMELEKLRQELLNERKYSTNRFNRRT